MANPKGGPGRSSSWKSGPTCTIRVPEAYKLQLTDAARALDEGIPVLYSATNDEVAMSAIARLRAACDDADNRKRSRISMSEARAILSDLEHYQARATICGRKKDPHDA